MNERDYRLQVTHNGATERFINEPKPRRWWLWLVVLFLLAMLFFAPTALIQALFFTFLLGGFAAWGTGPRLNR